MIWRKPNSLNRKCSSLPEGLKNPGDRESRHKSSELYSRPVYSETLKWGFKDHTAGEVTQETFVSVAGKIQQIECQSKHWSFQKLASSYHSPANRGSTPEKADVRSGKNRSTWENPTRQSKNLRIPSAKGSIKQGVLVLWARSRVQLLLAGIAPIFLFPTLNTVASPSPFCHLAPC